MSVKYSIQNKENKMKRLSPRSEKIFRAVMSQAADGCGKIVADGFMPLCVERVNMLIVSDLKCLVWSFAHYGEHNGDAMRDPDVEMFDGGDTFGLVPYFLRNDYAGVENDCLRIEDGRVIGVKTKLQHSLAEFCEMWAENINDQFRLGL